MTEDNSFPMPFLIEPEAAARRIANGMERRRMEIVFPLPIDIVAGLGKLVNREK